MSHADFVHLRVHSAYSLSEGALKIPDIASLCKANRMPAVAITDTNNLFGALEFSQTCAKAGIQPIVGCQLAVAFETPEPNRTHRNSFDELVLLAQNEAGYGNLLKLTSQAFLAVEAGASPHVPGDAVKAHAEGLIALTGGLRGPLGRYLAAGQGDAAEAVCDRLKAIFGDRLYIEISRQGVREETAIEPKLLALADAMNLPLVATNEAFFAEEGMYAAHDTLLCIAAGTSVNEPERRRLTPEFRFKTAQEMRAQFADVPEALDNTLVIAGRCAVMAETRAPILPHFVSEAGRSEIDELRHRATEGLEKRLADHVLSGSGTEEERAAAAAPYRERLDFELGVIESMGYPGYFLIVADFIQWAKGEGIPVGPGRGSGAGSVVAWALTITDLDPLRWGLLFERFLNPERVSMPDFDIDFCQERRDEVIRYVQRKYGEDRVAQIITFGKLQARAVLRDVGRVLQMPYGQIDRLCKLVPNNPANPVTLQEAIEIEPQLQEQRRQDESVARLIDIALQLEGLYRHASTHAAGVVIGDRPLEELIPLYRDPRSDMPVSQFNMKDVEKAGLVKFDFLGLKTLSVLQTAVDLLKVRGIEVDLERLPLDDTGTFEMISRADTTGVFQLESSGMRDVLRRLKPDRFEDIIAVVALYRPGPMENIPSYINRKHGIEAVAYDHPKLEPVLKETFGIPIYQEQVQQMARDLAGYTLGRADLLRRAMGKKIKAEMDAQGGYLHPRLRRAQQHRDPSRPADIRYHGGLCRLRFQQVPRRRLCPGGLSDRLVQGELSGRILCRLHVVRHGQRRQDRRFPARIAARGDCPVAARRQPVRSRVRRRGRRCALRTGGAQECRCGGDGKPGRRAGAERPVPGCRRSGGPARRRGRQQAPDGASDQGGRAGFPEPEPPPVVRVRGYDREAGGRRRRRPLEQPGQPVRRRSGRCRRRPAPARCAGLAADRPAAP